MNAFKWCREHQLAWMMTFLLGALVGLFIGFVVALNLQHDISVQYAGLFFWEVWIQHPERFLPWPLLGALIAGLGAYTVRLWRISS
jgi:hypothetical protein